MKMKIIIYNDEIYAYNEKNIEKVQQKILEKFNYHLTDKRIFTRCQTFVTTNFPCGTATVEFIGAYINNTTAPEDLATSADIGEYRDEYRIDWVKE